MWGGPAVLLAPGQARPTPARIFPKRSRTNTNLIDHARPGGRLAGSACGFLRRKDAGQVRLESAVRGDSEQPSSRLRSRIWMSLGTPWQRVSGGRRGSAPCQNPLMVLSSCQRRKTSQSVPQARLSVVNSDHRSDNNVCSNCNELCRGPFCCTSCQPCWAHNFARRRTVAG